MVTTRSKTRKLAIGSTRRVVNPSDSIAVCSIYLPDELMAEILVRVPAKPLLRFKCISRPWMTLISDPHFTRYHFSKSSIEEADLDFQILYATKNYIKKYCLYSLLHDARPSMQIFGNEFLAKNANCIVGILNGLICLNLKGTDLCIWNPALNRIRHIRPETTQSGHVCFFSFAYEKSNDDYKVVCLQTLETFIDKFFYAEVISIYSLKTDSWRRIEQFEGFYLVDSGVFANGKIYWSSAQLPNPDHKVFTLDISSERFAELETPKYDAGARPPQLQMGVSGGRLYVLSDYFEVNFSISEPKRLDLWVLDKYETEESWCRLVSIRYSDLDQNMVRFRYQVLRISSHGEIVFGNHYGLLVYNWKKKESRKIKLDVNIDDFSRHAGYVESLVWPDYD